MGLLRARAQAMIETVDSFQGKQLDVVILSCVRASAASASWPTCAA
jgi:superfamily I DNA and/or RNA helicase